MFLGYKGCWLCCTLCFLRNLNVENKADRIPHSYSRRGFPEEVAVGLMQIYLSGLEELLEVMGVVAAEDSAQEVEVSMTNLEAEVEERFADALAEVVVGRFHILYWHMEIVGEAAERFHNPLTLLAY